MYVDTKKNQQNNDDDQDYYEEGKEAYDAMESAGLDVVSLFLLE